MITPGVKCYKYEGMLVSDKEFPYGILIYRDVGSAPGYVPWDKIRYAEVVWEKTKNAWGFARKRKRSPAGKTMQYSAVGVPIEMFGDVVKASLMLYEEIGGKKVEGIESVGKVWTPLAVDVQVELEEDELIKKLNFRG